MQRAFTLVELAIVLAVISVVAAYVTPDLIEMARTGLAEKAAGDLIHVQDAARWFYHDSPSSPGDPGNPEDARWPGEAAPGACVMGAPNAQTEILGGGYLTPADLTNPWDQGFVMSMWTPTPGMPTNCRFVISTRVPAAVSRVLVAQAPLAKCELLEGPADTCPGAPGGGFDVCCTHMVKPGFEATEDGVLASVCEHMLGGLWDPINKECDPYGDWEWTNCTWISDQAPGGGMCPEGTVVVGSKETSCGKYCESTSYECCEGKSNN